MTHRFDDAVHKAVLAHMNGDHPDDNVLIVRAFSSEPLAASAVSAPSAVAAATMIGFDGAGGRWRVQPVSGDAFAVDVPWPGGHIQERAHVRREIVALYDESCRLLGVAPRPHA